MDQTQIVNSASAKFNEAKDHFADELKSLRTGRANASMLDGVVVEAYETTMPLNQLATVAAVDAQLIQVTPFDPNNLDNISAAIRSNAALGLNPSDDGHVIRLAVPPLTEERRREIAKQINEKVENCMIRMRGARHDAMNSLDQMKKDKDIGEDEAKRLEKQVDDSISKAKAQVDELAKLKEKEILTI